MNPILVELRRAEVLESFHRGVICVVDENNQVVYSKGDIQQVCYPRSAMKFFQHIPLITSGIFESYGFTNQQLAVMCGSHNGESTHTSVVKTILDKIELNEESLKCGAQPPTLKKDYHQLIRNNQEPQPIHNNCSGKHAGFLAWSKFKNSETGSYLSPEHPLQKEIRDVVAKFYEMDSSELKLGMDGCSAPTFAMPVFNQAIAFKNLVSPPLRFDDKIRNAANKIVDAVTEFPDMVAGTQRYCTDLMRVTKGRIVGKTGADGVYCIGIPSKKWGISIKIDDGKMGPQYQVAQELLKHLNLITSEEVAELEKYREFEMKNFAGNVTGKSLVVNI
jgi:L-asparaginase II